MEIQQAKEQVVLAGRELVRTGLIARTWGNVSCRIDGSSFVVTPSGRAYETLTSDEIVLCRTADASYEGEIKPSSERGVHALVYRMHPHAGFVIHTHQLWASAVSACGLTSIPVEGVPLLGDRIPVAAYGLPGTKKLRSGIAQALKENTGNAVIMAHHGALCFGRDYEEAFFAAQQLEQACEAYVRKIFEQKSGQVFTDIASLGAYYLSRAAGAKPPSPIPPACSRRAPGGFALTNNGTLSFRFTDTPLPGDADVHRAVYESRKDISFIVQAAAQGLLELSAAGKTLFPMLDDFAQLVGVSARTAKSNAPGDVVRALKGRAAVFLPNGGALCCANTQSDVEAVCMVMEKNTLAWLCSWLTGGGKPIHPLECRLMRVVYLKSYSKKANA